jgi:hypothetical protein
MKKKDDMISIEQAEKEVGKAIRRIALLHLAFAETIVKEMGEKAGKELIVKAIRNYGMKIGGKARQEALEKGLPLTVDSYGKVPGEPIPSFGTHSSMDRIKENGEDIIRAKDCLWAKVWKEYGGEELGRLYCLVDAAQLMSFNPKIKLIHLKAEPDGDNCCDLVFRETTEQEQKDFEEDRDWSYMDFDQK